MTPGVYWVEGTLDGHTVRYDIEVSFDEHISLTLGQDRFVCPGEVVVWTLPFYENATYKWNNGGSTNEQSTTTSGTYWVDVSNRCGSVREIVTLLPRPPSIVELGDDVIACNREVTLNYTPAPGETLLWSDGSTLPFAFGHRIWYVPTECE